MPNKKTKNMTRDEHCQLLEEHGWKIISKEPFEIEKYEEDKLVAKAFGQAAFEIAFHLEKDNKLPDEITLEDLATKPCYQHSSLTVGKLKEFIAKHNIPDHGKVLIERVKDFYYERNHWGAVFKKGFWYDSFVRRNQEMQEEIERRARGEEPEYPRIENPEKEILPLTKGMMNQYHPAFSPCGYNDDDVNLYIDLHY